MNTISTLNEQIQTQSKIAYPEKKIVFGEGNHNAKLVMIGEAPGGDEEKQGRPFVGKAGKNLSQFLEVVGLKREEIYITNVVKFRPTKESPKTQKLVNRTPTTKEVEFFLPYLQKELSIIQPEYVVTLGNVPLRAVLEDAKAVIGDYHGTVTTLQQPWKLFALYHPAAIIYNRALSETYQKDLEVLRTVLSSK